MNKYNKQYLACLLPFFFTFADTLYINYFGTVKLWNKYALQIKVEFSLLSFVSVHSFCRMCYCLLACHFFQLFVRHVSSSIILSRNHMTKYFWLSYRWSSVIILLLPSGSARSLFLSLLFPFKRPNSRIIW